LFGNEDEDDFEYTLQRSEFEEVCDSLFKKILNPVKAAIEGAKN